MAIKRNWMLKTDVKFDYTDHYHAYNFAKFNQKQPIIEWLVFDWIWLIQLPIKVPQLLALLIPRLTNWNLDISR